MARRREWNDDDRKTYVKYRQTLEAHTEQVCEEMQRLDGTVTGHGAGSCITPRWRRRRDFTIGVSNPVMQATLQGTELAGVEPLAKSAGNGSHSRRFFRHELASALAMIGAGESDLAAYLAAAHHGRIRVVVRSMPGERDAGRELARVRGIDDGDALLKCSLGGGVERLETAVWLELREAGFRAPEREKPPGRTACWKLRNELGPFRLAYLEMLLRIADETASARAEKEAAV